MDVETLAWMISRFDKDVPVKIREEPNGEAINVKGVNLVVCEGKPYLEILGDWNHQTSVCPKDINHSDHHLLI